MKKSIIIITFGMLIILTSTCTPGNQTTSNMVNPGDKIGDFLITTAAENDDIYYVSKSHCPFDVPTKTETCEVYIGTKVNVSNSYYGDNYEGKNLDKYWEEQQYELFIEGQPVNLQAFGPIDTSHPVAGKLRNWNVVIFSDQPGTITVHHKDVFDGIPEEGNNKVIFITP